MSRFYEALTEASRQREQPNDPGKSSPAKPFSPHEFDLPTVPPLPPGAAFGEVDPAEDAFAAGPAAAPPQGDRAVLEPAGTRTSGQTTQAAEFGVVAKMTLDPRARILPQVIDPAIVEHYGMLRTKILQLQPGRPFRTILVASPSPRDGKTVTVLNLAFSFAMLPSFKVLIVDGDMRKGSLAKWMGVDDRLGLSNLLDGSAKLEDVVLASDDQPLCVVPRGTSQASAAELLNSPELGSHFRRMGEHFDLVLVDSPPATLVSDARLLAGGCDAVLLVARAFGTTRKALEAAAHELHQFRLLGAVLNGGSRPLASGAKGYYYRGEVPTR